MTPYDHWHPVVLADRLRRQPLAVRLHGHDLVLFRGRDGGIGALDNCCPHRRMRLDLGSVEGGKLRCAYHGWTFDCDGAGESPGTPKLHAQAGCFEAREELGAIWVRAAGSQRPFPQIDVDGYHFVCALQHQAPAPLELVVDNFCEIEHTPTTHAVFGYALERMHEVEVRFEPTETSVRVVNIGPPKRLPWLLRLLLGVRRGWQFNDDWTTYFSPVYSVYEHWWSDRNMRREAMVRWRLFIFFTPADEHHTTLLTFAYAKSRYPGPRGAVRLFRGAMRRMLSHEIDLDVRILSNLANRDPSLDGMKLSRFDRVLGLNRERIERIYRGQATGNGSPAAPVASRAG